MWQIEISSDAGLTLSKLNAETQKQILADLRNDLLPILEKRKRHKPSLYGSADLWWPFLSGDYRLQCRLNEDKKIVSILQIRHLAY